MGSKENIISSPWSVSRPLSLCLEIVRMVACSARHTLVLTTLGLVYSCGDNTEGALGSGDVTSRHNMQVLSQWYVVDTSKQNDQAGLTSSRPSADDRTDLKLAENPPVIIKIAAGAGIIGSHSMALDENGNLYSWGVAQATGHGMLSYFLIFILMHMQAL